MDWKEPKAVAGVKLPRDLHRAVKTLSSAAGSTVEAAYTQALEAWLAHSGYSTVAGSGDAPIAEIRVSGPSPKKENVGVFPDEVISILQKHWSDPDFRACLAALGIVWDVGDEDIKGSLGRNCGTFARSSRMVEALKEHGISDAELPGFDTRRIGGLLRHASHVKPGHLRGAGLSGGAAGGREGTEGLGDKPIRKDRGKGGG